jgi:hypothetical protein
MAQGILKSIFGGGIPQNAQGRPGFMSDRNAGARDTVYRKPAAKVAPAKSGGGGGGGGHKKHGGGGKGPLTTSAIPTPRPGSIGNDPRGAPDPLLQPMQTPTGAPGFLPTQSPSNQPGFVPMMSPTSQPSDLPVMQTPTSAPGDGMPPMMTPTGADSFAPQMGPSSGPGPQWPTSPTSVPGPGRAELAALLAGKKKDPHSGVFGYTLPEGLANYHLPGWLGGTGG